MATLGAAKKGQGQRLVAVSLPPSLSAGLSPVSTIYTASNDYYVILECDPQVQADPTGLGKSFAHVLVPAPIRHLPMRLESGHGRHLGLVLPNKMGQGLATK
jgi:hypothetical protein